MGRDIDFLLADNCHINPDTPHLEKSTPEALRDWAADVWSTATDPKVLREIGGGAVSEVTTTSGALETLGSVGLGVAARAVGGVLAAVPASAYLLGREGAELVINGPEAAADDTWALVTAPFDDISEAYDAAQVVHNNDTSDPAKLNAAKLVLRNAGASALPALGLAIGGASGDLGPQALRAATNGAQSTAMTIGRASFGDPLGLEPAYAGMGKLGNLEITGTPIGSPTKPLAVATGEGSVLLSQNADGNDGGNEPAPARQLSHTSLSADSAAPADVAAKALQDSRLAHVWTNIPSQLGEEKLDEYFTQLERFVQTGDVQIHEAPGMFQKVTKEIPEFGNGENGVVYGAPTDTELYKTGLLHSLVSQKAASQILESNGFTVPKSMLIVDPEVSGGNIGQGILKMEKMEFVSGYRLKLDAFGEQKQPSIASVQRVADPDAGPSSQLYSQALTLIREAQRLLKVDFPENEDLQNSTNWGVSKQALEKIKRGEKITPKDVVIIDPAV